MEIRYSKAAFKTLKGLAKNVRDLIVSKIEQFAADPSSLENNVSKLQGRDGYRLRVGAWRVIFDRTLEGEIEIMDVLEVMPRGDDYKE